MITSFKNPKFSSFLFLIAKCQKKVKKKALVKLFILSLIGSFTYIVVVVGDIKCFVYCVIENFFIFQLLNNKNKQLQHNILENIQQKNFFFFLQKFSL